MSLRLAPIALSLALFGPSVASAQEDDPEAGETGSPEAQAAPPPAKPNTWGVTASGSATAASETDEWETAGSSSEPAKRERSSGESDHENVVGSIGIGLLGLAEVPVGTVGGGARSVDPVLTAPVLGARYWMGERIGLEVGVGFMIRSGDVQDGVNTGDVSSRAFALHGGLPFALAWGEHYNLLAIPYVGFGFSKATDPRGNASNVDDIFGDGFVFEAGLRAGVEIQLGAIGLEGFALQLTGGVRLRMETRTANIPLPDEEPPSAYDLKTKEIVFATSPGSTLGSAVAGCLAALYYF